MTKKTTESDPIAESTFSNARRLCCPNCGCDIPQEWRMRTEPELFLCRICQRVSDDSEGRIAGQLAAVRENTTAGGPVEVLPSGLYIRRDAVMQAVRCVWWRGIPWKILYVLVIAMSIFLLGRATFRFNPQGGWHALWVIPAFMLMIFSVIRWLSRLRVWLKSEIAPCGERVVEVSVPRWPFRWRRFRCRTGSRVDLVLRRASMGNFRLRKEGNSYLPETLLRIRPGAEISDISSTDTERNGVEILIGGGNPSEVLERVGVEILAALQELGGNHVRHGDGTDPRIRCPGCESQIPINWIDPVTELARCDTCGRETPLSWCVQEVPDPERFRKCIRKERVADGIRIHLRLPTGHMLKWMYFGLSCSSLACLWTLSSGSEATFAYISIPVTIGAAILSIRTYETQFAWKNIVLRCPDEDGEISGTCAYGFLFRQRFEFVCNATTHVMIVNLCAENSPGSSDLTVLAAMERMRAESSVEAVVVPVIFTDDVPVFAIQPGIMPMPHDQQQYLATVLRESLAELIDGVGTDIHLEAGGYLGCFPERADMP